MLIRPETVSAQLAADRSARLSRQAAAAGIRRLARQPIPDPSCAGLATRLAAVALDLRTEAPSDQETATR